MFRLGGLKEHAWKVCIRETVSRAETICRGGCLGADRNRRHSNLISVQKFSSLHKINKQRGVRVVEGARLESVYTGNRIEGSNPFLSARINLIRYTKSKKACKIKCLRAFCFLALPQFTSLYDSS